MAGLAGRMGGGLGRFGVFSPLPNAEPRAEFHFLTKHPNAKDMAFVGLTERWDESVCLFHRMLPGIVD